VRPDARSGCIQPTKPRTATEISRSMPFSPRQQTAGRKTEDGEPVSGNWAERFALTGKRAMVAGASSGLGEGIALVFAGARIPATGRNLLQLQKLKARIEVDDGSCSIVADGHPALKFPHGSAAGRRSPPSASFPAVPTRRPVTARRSALPAVGAPVPCAGPSEDLESCGRGTKDGRVSPCGAAGSADFGLEGLRQCDQARASRFQPGSTAAARSG